MQADVLHRHAPFVVETDALEAKFAADVRRHLAGAAHRHRHVQQVHHPVHRRHGALVQIHHVGQAGQRPQQALGEVYERRIAAHAQLAAQGEHAAVKQRGHEAGQDGHADDRRDRRRKTNGVGVARAEAVRGLAQVFGLELFGGVGLDGGHAGQVVVEPGRYRGRGFARRGITRGQPLLEPEGADQDQRYRQHRQRRQAGGQHEEHRADQQRGNHHLDQVVGTGVEETFDLVDVFVHQRHQPAAAFAFDHRRRQPLQMAVGGLAQGVLQFLGEPAPLHRQQVFEQGLERPDRDRQGHQQVQLVQRVGHAQAGQEGVLLVHHHVHGHADEQLGQHVEELVEHRIDRGGHGGAPVGAGEAGKPAQRVFAGHGGSLCGAGPGPGSIFPCGVEWADAYRLQ